MESGDGGEGGEVGVVGELGAVVAASSMDEMSVHVCWSLAQVKRNTTRTTNAALLLSLMLP